MAGLPQSPRQAGPPITRTSNHIFLPFLCLRTVSSPSSLFFLVTSCLVFLPITLLILAGPPQKSSPRGFRPLIPLNTPKLMECSPSLSWKNPAAKTKGITKFPKPTHRKDVLLSRKPRNQAQSNGVKHLYLFIFSHKFLCLFF